MQCATPQYTTASYSMSTCGSSAFPLPCPLTPPTDGIGGSCYTVPFAIPICPTHNYTAHNTNNSSANGSDSTTAILTQYATFEVLDAAFYRPRAATLLVASMGLAISVLTLANVIVLTPGRKMGRPIHTAVVVGLIAEIVSNGCGVYLSTAGAQVSSYLVLTGDWSSTTWSVAHRGAMTAQLLAAVVAFSAVQVAFAVQGGAMCAWVRVRWGLASYHFVIGVLVVVGAVAWVFTVAFMGYQIRWVAFVGLGPGIEEYLPAVYQRSWWLWLSGGYRVSGCLSLGLWSVCFAVGAGFVLWQRRDVVFTLDSAGGEQSEGTMAGLMGRRKRVRTAYESTLRLIGVVAVESFAVPSEFCLVYGAVVGMLLTIDLSSCPLHPQCGAAEDSSVGKPDTTGHPGFVAYEHTVP